MNVEKDKKEKNKVHLKSRIFVQINYVEVYTPFGYGDIPEPKAMEESKETGEEIEMKSIKRKETNHVKVNLFGGGVVYIQVLL